MHNNETVPWSVSVQDDASEQGDLEEHEECHISLPAVEQGVRYLLVCLCDSTGVLTSPPFSSAILHTIKRF